MCVVAAAWSPGTRQHTFCQLRVKENKSSEEQRDVSAANCSSWQPVAANSHTDAVPTAVRTTHDGPGCSWLTKNRAGAL